jgi:hypothetical protein
LYTHVKTALHFLSKLDGQNIQSQANEIVQGDEDANNYKEDQQGEKTGLLPKAVENKHSTYKFNRIEVIPPYFVAWPPHCACAELTLWYECR